MLRQRRDLRGIYPLEPSDANANIASYYILGQDPAGDYQG